MATLGVIEVTIRNRFKDLKKTPRKYIDNVLGKNQ
jgi:hypothetical protein